MARKNFSFEKRKKEEARQKKREDKIRARREKRAEDEPVPADGVESVEEGQPLPVTPETPEAQ